MNSLKVATRDDKRKEKYETHSVTSKGKMKNDLKNNTESRTLCKKI